MRPPGLPLLLLVVVFVAVGIQSVRIGRCDVNDFKCNDGTCIRESMRCNNIRECRDGEDEQNCRCLDDEFQCRSGMCIENRKQCDGKPHCPDNSDEENCPYVNSTWSGVHVCESRGQFLCGDGSCVSVLVRCNGMVDCPKDSADEVDCPCTPDQWQCDFGSCIARSKKCDGFVDCPSDHSDERHCFRESYEDCQPGFFACDDGACVPNSDRCDGEQHCRDSSDEKNCPTTNDKCDMRCDDGKCVDQSMICNGFYDCKNGIDERNCDKCGPNEFRCGDGQCIQESLRCNNVVECEDGSDEQHCSDGGEQCASNEFRCRSGQCIQSDFKCDKSNDCDDSSDEADCEYSPPISCPSGEFECDGACHSISIKCDTYRHCSDGADEIDCGCSADEYACNDGSCIPFKMACNGNRDCRDGSDEEECGLLKSWTINQCEESQFACHNGGCVPHIQRCDNVYDCRDFSDEQNCFNSDCSDSQWKCSSSECINYYKRCDGIPDCRDGSDESESICPQLFTTQRPTILGCTRNQFRCSSGDCIDLSQQCDGNYDCPDDSDERSPPCSPRATQRPQNIPGELDLKTYPDSQVIKQSQYLRGGEVVFQCRDEGILRVPIKWIREGGRPLPQGSTDIKGRLEIPNVQMNDAGGYICTAIDYPISYPGSQIHVQLTVEILDKAEPSRPPKYCQMNQATCSNGQCIPKGSVCNGVFDCADKSDELGCKVHGRCEPNEFMCKNNRCILKSWLCDSEDDCRDGSDEICEDMPNIGPCRPSEFQCQSSQCVPKSYHCDGEKDCQDGSDEYGCSPVYISKPPIPMIHLQIGETMTITCVAVGMPYPHVSWRLNWGHIPDKCRSTTVNGLGTLVCPNVQLEDQGAYSCEAINNKGSVFAVPDTILIINATVRDVCPSGYFNREARVVRECISCFCFGVTTQCNSADLFTYQIPPSLNTDSSLAGVIKPPGQPLQITDEPITDIFQLDRQYTGAMISRIGQWSSRNIYPYLSLPETYSGSQLTSYGGYIKYTLIPQGDYPPPSDYSPLPDIIIKGGDTIIMHDVTDRLVSGKENYISVRLFEGPWKKVTSTGERLASREDIMMVLANIEKILLRAEEGGAGVEIKNFQMDSARDANSGQGLAAFVENCQCPMGYSGLSCQSCSPGFRRVASGRWLGQCTREEANCQPGYYGNPSRGIACQQCPCPLTNSANQFSRTCHLAADAKVTCNSCPPGYIGRRCEACDVGYVGNPIIPGDYCRPAPLPSRCDQRGTLSEDNGVCNCKIHATGSRCSECAPQAFFLSSENILGCSQCFCMGVTRSCSSSTWRRASVMARFGSKTTSQEVRLLPWNELSNDQLDPFSGEDLVVDSVKQEISFSQFDRTKSTIYYWSLPNRFIGDKVTAYGGYLNYTIRHIPTPGGQSSKNNAPDIQLRSKNDITLVHYSGATPNSDGYLSGTVQFLDKYWQRTDGLQGDREHMLMALADLKEILIKATYTTGAQQASLVSASLEVADERGVGDRASHVEHCQCPAGYLGTSCEDCAPGYTRTLGGLYLGLCEPCNCNGHSDQCHPETGDCENCQHNTKGLTCDECEVGYSGDASVGSVNDCRLQPGDEKCRCDKRGTQFPYCVDGPSFCRCKPNVEGDLCNQCRPGTFDLSSDSLLGCTECYCSGVTDVCYKATYLYRQQIPSAIIDDTHGFTLTTLDRQTVFDSNFQLDVPFNQIGYNFGRPSNERLFWSLPDIFTGNKISSYGGSLAITQKFDSYNQDDYSSDDMDVMLVGREKTLFWKNPTSLRAGESVTYSVPFFEDQWNLLSVGNGARPVTRSELLTVLANLQQILVRATLSTNTISTSIADVVMDTAVSTETSQPLVDHIEVCKCPSGYTGSSCEVCSAGNYRTKENRCERCPCSQNEESCQLGLNGQVYCYCKPTHTGFDCSIDINDEVETSTGYYTPAPQPVIQVLITHPTIRIKEVGSTVQFKCVASSRYSQTPLRVSWSKENGMLPLERVVQDIGNGLLIITSVRESDSGIYICEATDGVNIATSTANLVVPANEPIAPEVILTPSSLEVYEGETIEVQCSSIGSPIPELTWTRTNRRPINRLYTFANGMFRIESARVSDQGEYRCVARNSAGNSQKSVMIYVQQRTERPSQTVLMVNPPYPNIREGASLTLVCSADQEIPSNLITWERLNGFMPRNFRISNGQLWIEEIRPEDAGLYKCSADRVSEDVVSVTVEIIVQRQVSHVPSNVQIIGESSTTIAEGEGFSVNCEPSGSPLPTIKWTRIGSEFEPGVVQRMNKLIIPQAKWSDRGTYLCIGLSNDGSTLAQSSIAITVERREKPEVEVWPTGVQAMILGSDAFLQCRILKGTPEPILTWTRPSGRSLSTNAHLKPNGVLSLTDISINDEGVYTCIASNAIGQSSANATIVVHSQPQLTIRPDTVVNARAGESLTVECRAKGYPEPEIHWALIHPYEREMTRSSRDGVTILSFSSFEERDEGTYACIGRNDAGTTEERVQITLKDNDIVDSLPERGDIAGEDGGAGSEETTYDPPSRPGDVLFANEGTSIDLTCRGSTPSIGTLEWSRQDNKPLPPGSYKQGSNLYLVNVTAQDSGYYQCIAHVNDLVIAQARTYLNIRRPPRITLQPAIQTVRPGETATLSCVAQGDQPMQITWNPSKGVFPKRVEVKNNSLVFHGIEVSDAGLYICRAFNEAGNAEAIAEVIVNEEGVDTHEATSNSRDQKAAVNSRVLLCCGIQGDNYRTSVTWTKSGIPISRDAKTLNGRLLILERVQLKDSGRYECQIIGARGGVLMDYVNLTVTGDICKDDEFQCTITKTCIPHYVLCDGYPDCDDHSDEKCSNTENIHGATQNSVEISPQRLSVREGESVTVTCRTTGESFDLRWRKESSRERVNTRPIPNGLILEINRATPNDAGTYRCDGRDRTGSAKYEDFTLIVLSDTRRSAPYSEVQSDAPEVFSAPLGSTVQMPCKTDLPAPVTFLWERPYALLPENLAVKSPTLQLMSVSESDAGPYTCKVTNGQQSMERRIILKVTHIVPQFARNGFVAMKTINDAYISFDIEIAVKPLGRNGIILYNSQKPGRDSGDYVSLALVNGVPEFRYSLGSGVASISGDQPLSMNEWHNLKISRNEKDGFLYVDGKGPFVTKSPEKSIGLDLEEPLYIGGVPDYNQLPEELNPKQGFEGCIGRLVLEDNDLSIMKDGIEKVNVNECDSCTPNPCQNNAVCQEALTERGHACLCPEGFSGLDCSQTGDACRPGLCGPGRCTDTTDGFKCICPIGYVGDKCESRLEIEYPAFGGGAYLAYAPPKTGKHLRMGMRIKPGYPVKDGLILYCAESRHGHGDFTSLAVKDNHLEFRFSVGSSPTIIRSNKPLIANQWVNVNISRFLNRGKLSIEGQDTVAVNVSKNRKSIFYKTPLYVGGYNDEWLTINKGTEVDSGFNGCIADVELLGTKLDIINSPIESANVRECSDDYDTRRRGDINPEATQSPSESICSLCQNGGRCIDPLDEYCECPSGYEGQYCETTSSQPGPTDTSSYTPCEVQPCQRNGTCRPLRTGLFKCDCPLGTGGFNCQNRVELRDDCSLTGEGYIELPASLMPHDKDISAEVMAIAFTTNEPDGLLLLQGENNRDAKDGDFIMLQINGGYVEFQWELGEGVATVRNDRVLVSDNLRHSVVVRRTGSEVMLEVDRIDTYGKSPGITQLLNADSNIYIGGTPSHMTSSGLIGFSGCIHQVELMDLGAIHLGKTAVASRNANPCSNLETNDLTDEIVNK